MIIYLGWIVVFFHGCQGGVSIASLQGQQQNHIHGAIILCSIVMALNIEKGQISEVDFNVLDEFFPSTIFSKKNLPLRLPDFKDPPL